MPHATPLSIFTDQLRNRSRSDQVELVLNKLIETDAPCLSTGGQTKLVLFGVEATGESLHEASCAWIDVALGDM